MPKNRNTAKKTISYNSNLGNNNSSAASTTTKSLEFYQKECRITTFGYEPNIWFPSVRLWVKIKFEFVIE